MQISEVKTREQLEKFISECENAGFRWGTNTWQIVQWKLQDIIHKANTLNVEYNSKQLEQFFDGNFENFAVQMTAHFSQFSTDDKIFEIIRKYANIDHVTENGGDRLAKWNSWLAKGFKPLHPDNKEVPHYFGVYDFTKEPTKTKFRFSDYSHGINAVLKVLGASWGCPYFSEFSTAREPETENLKVFKNGNVLIHDKEIAARLLEWVKKKYLDPTPAYGRNGLYKD